MNVYSRTDEENIRDSNLLREWIESGLLRQSQQPALTAELASSLRTLHPVFRLLLAIFSALIIGALVALVAIQLEVRAETAIAVLFGLSAAACLGLAWVLASRLRVYRWGVEEAACLLAVLFSGLSAAFMLEPFGASLESLFAAVTGVAAAAAFFVYAIFGFRYMGVAGVILAGITPFQLNADIVIERILSVVIFIGLFIAARDRAVAFRGGVRGRDFEWMQAIAWGGIYAALHQKLAWVGLAASETGIFYWWTYGMIWILPVAGLWLGIRDRDRILLDLSAVLGLITLISNKPYLGWTRQTWDPILLGVLLISVAAFLRRWLSAGEKGSRAGFTPERLLARENRYIDAASVVSFAVQQPDIQLPKPTESGGGRSGGGGASGNF